MNRVRGQQKIEWDVTAHIGGELLLREQGNAQAEEIAIESLVRRYETSDKSWMADWLSENDDPCDTE